jgi:cytoskeleton protein RodZ
LPDVTPVSAVEQPDMLAASAVQAVPHVEPAATPPVQAKHVETVATPVAQTAPQAKPQMAVIVPAKPKAALPVPVVAAAAVPPVPGVPLEQLKKRPIHIVFSEDAWMEIKDVNGEILLSRMNTAGSEKWIGGGRRAPYQVAIGKASAVRIYYKGREVDLSQHKQTGLVHLVLE